MLTDIALKKLKPREKPYKVTDRDGMYVTVSPAGTITFRFDYRISNRRETLTLGRYGPAGLSLSAARDDRVGVILSLSWSLATPLNHYLSR